MQRSTATKKTNTSKAGNKEKDDEAAQAEGEKHFDCQQAAVLSRGTKEQSLSDESVSSESMRKDKIPMDYREKNLELQLMYVSAYCESA